MATVANVLAGKPVTAGGGVSYAKPGTTLPTDATESLDEDFVNGGFISDDGLTESTEKSSDKVKAWGGTTVKNLQTDSEASFSFTFIESVNADVLKAIVGEDNVTTDDATAEHGKQITAKYDLEQLPVMIWNFDVKDGPARVRVSVPQGQITEIGDVTYTDDEVIGYEVTVDTLWDDDLGAYFVKYMDDGKKSS